MLIFKIKFKGKAGTTIEVSAAKAKRLADGYIGRVVNFRGKEREVRAARFDSTRGFVLTDTKGKTFLFAEIVDTDVSHETPDKSDSKLKKMRKEKPVQDVADIRVRLERDVIREARQLTCGGPELHISDSRLVAYLARLGLRELRRNAKK